MPAKVIDAYITHLAAYLAEQEEHAVPVWDGEVPRYDTAGDAVAPTSTTGNWPAVKLTMVEPGFSRSDTVGLTGSATDSGQIKTQVYATTREEAERIGDLIEDCLEQQRVLFTELDLGGPPSNPHYQIDSNLAYWWSGQDDENRTATSQLLYRFDMTWNINLKVTANTGAVA